MLTPTSKPYSLGCRVQLSSDGRCKPFKAAAMRSKRQRKQKDRNSLKRKHGEIQSVARGTCIDLSPSQQATVEPAAEGLLEKDSNALVMLPKTARRQGEPAATQPEAKVSKAEKRKLRQIAREKELKLQREQVFATLAEHALPEREFALLKSSATLGQRESKRQRVARELGMQRTGLPLPEDAELERRRKSSIDATTSYGAQPQLLPAAGAATPGPRDTAEDSAHKSLCPEADKRPDLSSPEERQDTGPQASSALDPEEIRTAVEQARAEFGLPAAGNLPEQPAAAPRHSAPSGKSRLVAVERPPEIEAARSQLPIIGMEQEVVEAVLENDVVVLSGETGCGKTTQVPQFLYEAGYGCKAFLDRGGLIGITQPRRVAAIASAQRVSAEFGTSLGSLVGYQVRYDRRFGDGTAVKFMTDGILLREVQDDFLLRRYSCLVVDEAHERSLNTDLIIGMLSRIVPLRRQMAAEGRGAPLKLLIMSATLRTEDFVGNRRLFPAPPPLVHVPARQYPVTLHFSKKTELHDYVGVAFSKVSQIHQQLPPGGILVFLTGQREVEALCKRLRTSLVKQPGEGPEADAAAAAAPRAENGFEGGSEGGTEAAFGEDAAENAEGDADPLEAEATADDDFDGNNLSEEEETQLLGGEGFSPEQLAAAEKRFEEQMGLDGSKMRERQADGPAPVHVLPLYAMLPQAAQARVFAPVPAGHGLIVVATNVAETSLTIPGIRYVVDAGRAKQKLLEPGTGIAKYEVGWISKASSQQRAGRAGRTGPGHCYRLFSSAVYNDAFSAHTPPEIMNTALEGVVLVMKAMGIEKVDNFPYPTAPQAAGLREAQQCLVALGAMDPETGALTELGRALSGYPISPRHARMILEVATDRKLVKEVLPYAVALAAATSAETPFVSLDSIQGKDGDAESAGRERQSARAAHSQLRDGGSDALSALNALVAYEAAANPAHFCTSHRLHGRHLAEMAALHKQLKRIVAHKLPEASLHSQLQQKPPAAISYALRRAMAAGWADQVARRVRAAEHVAHQGGLTGKKRAVRYRCAMLDEDVYLHPHSALHATAPDFVTYTQVVRSAKRPYMAGITEIAAHWLVSAAAPLCSVSAPLDEPQPQYVAKADAVMAWHEVSFGRHQWELPRTRRQHPDAATRARVFAAALLDGSVLPSMSGLKAYFVVAPATAAKAEAQGQPRVGHLVSRLLQNGIDSKASLKAAWKRNKELLKPELAAWLKKGHTSALLAVWQHLLSESQSKVGKQIKR